MKNAKRIIVVVLAAALTLSVMSMLGACGQEPEPTETTASVQAGEKVSHTITVESVGGMALEGLQVYVYADNTLTDLKQYGETDANGKISFDMVQSKDYAITLTGVPKGYKVEQTYSFTGTIAEISLKSALVEGESISGASLGLGDVMYDFSVAAPDGTKITLSEILAEKKMVMLNFWYSSCGPCVNEFPYIEEAYRMYKDDIEIIALNSYPLDTDSSVAAFKEEMNLSFPMAKCGDGWLNSFGSTGYPTSVIVDRYGVICLVEIGGMPSLRPFVSIFDTFTAEDYEQKLYTSVDEIVTVIKPTYEMPTSDEIAGVINVGEIPVTYHAETDPDSAEITWPFIITEKSGEACLKASNQGIDDSFAILYANVELKAGQAIGFDYLISCELSNDAMVVIVDGEDINQMSGYNEVERWETCYPWVALEDGTYEVALCFLKDEADNIADDTVYIKNMHIVDADQITTAARIPREAAITEDGFEYSYVDIVLNETDGYYHVGTMDGPLLLANLMNYSQFNEDTSVWQMASDGKITENGVNYLDQITPFCTLASNSAMTGYCTVTAELAELLKIVDRVAGFDDADENEWLKLCTYYQVYGSDTQVTDPIKGLATFSAYTALEGKGVSTNYFYYDRIIMPRGLFAEFIPNKSGVYRITSSNESVHGVDGWIFGADVNESREALLTYEHDERMYEDENDVSMVYYMEAGKPYYIDIAFWDPYEVGYIYYDIEYVGSQYDLFRLCAPGYFTYDTNATGDAMYHLITGGIDVVLGSDGYYHEDLGDGKQGSIIYADFTGLTPVFSTPIATVGKIKGMIEKGGFDFSKTEYDLTILSYMSQNNNDPVATDAYLKELWGADYDSNAKLYQIKDVFAGRYHGAGEDLTEEMRAYTDKIISGGAEELQGCVAVDERLAQILQMLMEKYTFENVDHSWTKLCYYYDHLG